MTMGGRIKEERKRLGKNQVEFALLGGVQISAQTNYETDKRAPDAAYLFAVAGAGADVQYIVTGERRGQGLGESAVHQAVLDAVDLLSLAKKVDADQLARAVVKLCTRQAPAGNTATTPTRIDQQINGSNHQITRSGKIVNKGRK